MTNRILITFTAIIGLFACSCASRTSPDFKASVSTIQQYADSFAGISVDEARSRLTGAKFSETEWKEGGFGGKQLVATFPNYEIRVMYLGDKAITTSVQIPLKIIQERFGQFLAEENCETDVFGLEWRRDFLDGRTVMFE